MNVDTRERPCSSPALWLRRASGIAVVVAFALAAAASGGPGGSGGPIEGFNEGVNDALQDDEFNPFVCDRCGESPSAPGEGEGEGEGPDACAPYAGPEDDIQRDSNCQAAWNAECYGQDKQAYCDTYNASGWGSPGNCPYC